MNEQLRPKPPAAIAAVVLTCVAGYVDAIGYLRLGSIYLANMSGNSVSVGIHAARLDGYEVWRHGWPILSYVIGLLSSRILVSWGAHRRRTWVISAAFAIECAALAAFLAIGRGTIGVFLVALAMGVQAATLSRFNGVSIYTSFVTGSLVKMAAAAADVFWDAIQKGIRAAFVETRSWQAAWYAANWIGYLAGAIAATLLLERIGARAAAAAVAVIAGFAVVAWRSPGSIGSWNGD